MPTTPRKSASILAAALAASLAGCASSTSKTTPEPGGQQLIRAAPASRPVASQADMSATSQGSTAFGLDLYRAMAAPGAADAGKNVMISPVSLTTLLGGMLLPGMRGLTATEIAKVLHTQLPVDRYAVALGSLDAATVQRATADKSTLQQSDTLWTQKGYGIKQPYLDLLAAAFDTGVRETDFAADPEKSRQAVNALVEQQTAGLIKELFPPGSIGSSTRLALTDAIYFKAAWADAFEPQATTNQPFHLLDGTSPSAPTMSRTGSYSYASGSGWQAVELPYQGGHLAMDVLLPDAGTFDAFRTSLDAPHLASMLGGLQSGSVEVSLPKFTFDSGAELNDTLAKLGMPTVFSSQADLGGIPSNGEQLYVNIVVEKAHIAVDEQGTTAAAGGGVGMMPTSARSVMARVDVDRPFMFVVRDTVSGQVLFLGQVTNPQG